MSQDLVVQKKAEIEVFSGMVDEVVQIGMLINVCSNQTAIQALKVISQARDIVDQIEARQKAITEDAKKFLSCINSATKSLCDKLETLQDALDAKLNDFTFQNHLQKLSSEDATCIVKQDYQFVVEDLDMVPSNLLMVDEKKVKAMIKAGIDVIPGLTITQKQKIEVKRKAI